MEPDVADCPFFSESEQYGHDMCDELGSRQPRGPTFAEDVLRHLEKEAFVPKIGDIRDNRATLPRIGQSNDRIWVPARAVRHLAVAFLLCSVVVLPGGASAHPTLVLEVAATRSDVTHVEASTIFRGVFQSQLDKIDRSRFRKSAVISATLVRFENHLGTAECIVAALVRSKDGKLLATIEGRATAAKGTRASLLVGGAVDVALASLSRALD